MHIASEYDRMQINCIADYVLLERLMDNLVKNAIFTAEIDAYSSDGMGVCRIDGRAVFVKGALMGEVWEVKIMKVTSAAVYARGMRCIVASPERVPEQCPVFGKCGGCDFRHGSYAEELRYKKQRVTDALQRIAGVDFEVREIFGSEKTGMYRNKVIYSFGELNGKPVVGFYRSRTHEVIPVERCLLQPELADRAAAAVRDWAEQENISVYDSLKCKGLLRHVFVRCAVKTDDAVVCIVAAGGFGAATSKLVDVLREKCPELTGIVLCVNKTKGNTVLAGDLHTLWGRAEITDELCGIRYEISPFAFFQINPPQAERLYQKALEFAAPGAADTVLDLYCGAGTITLCLAQRAGKVIGAEIVSDAIENAKLNAARNGIENAEFLCADASDAARIFRERGIRPKVIVVDPPRKGLAPEVVDTMAEMQPERIVYVSCDPATMARDVRRFVAQGYRLHQAVAFDLFPRCAHVESVVLLIRTEATAGT